ncbi:TIGR03016 family PEP-CTERM system-associated outer membrane protein [Noviherbaspirillum cavernae]|uniref:TIGR03016 family PEP-CTERM system-associated outer membrane protein n=1 Tax=Noviherbaspirillum cavernae TaxID=2320862 RepID=UPI00131433DE|nr:TIGR03016 family PEP-CTERM system-associated outer membrane protein [Noviherbaspirillum cavernae]
MEKNSWRLAGTAAVVALALCPPTMAAEWKFTPALDIAETYTDNLRLSPSGSATSDFVTQISPGIAIAGTGRGLHVKADYVMQNLAYARERSGISTNHMLNARANAELVEELFFLDGKAAISQQNVSPFGPQTNSNLNLTDNRADVRTWNVSPHLRHRFGQTATAQLRYTRDAVDTSTGSLLDTESDRVLFNLNSGPAFKSLGWGVQYSNQKTHYSDAATLEMEEIALNLRYLISPRFSLTTSVGHEDNNYLSIGEQPSGYFWSAGFVWTPSERTSITASAGRRFYGASYSLAASHRTRNTVWSVGYHEDITTTQSQFAVPMTIDTAGFLNQLWKSSIPDSETRAQVVDAFIRSTGLPASLAQAVNTFTNRVFLQKTAQASVALNSAKNTLVLSLFNTRRDGQSTQAIDNALLGAANALLEDNTRQFGANAVWNWRLSSRTSLNFGAGYTRAHSISTGRRDNDKSFRLALVRQFQPRLKGVIEYRRLRHASSESNSDFRENAITASLLMGF